MQSAPVLLLNDTPSNNTWEYWALCLVLSWIVKIHWAYCNFFQGLRMYLFNCYKKVLLSHINFLSLFFFYWITNLAKIPYEYCKTIILLLELHRVGNETVHWIFLAAYNTISFYFKRTLHYIKILITVRFNNCYCYKQECRTIFFMEINYIVIIFKKNHKEENLGCLVIGKNQVLSELFTWRKSIFPTFAFCGSQEEHK